MRKHTKGPWTFDSGSPLIWRNNNIVAQLPLDGISFNAANAKLIASAPEMLEALKAIQWGLASNGDELLKAYKLVDLVVKKAEGK